MQKMSEVQVLLVFFATTSAAAQEETLRATLPFVISSFHIIHTADVHNIDVHSDDVFIQGVVYKGDIHACNTRNGLYVGSTKFRVFSH